MHHFILDLSPIWIISSLMMIIMLACVAGRCLQNLYLLYNKRDL
jgi:hypothetical protein